ncbi:MAG: hypothetical protein Q7R87_01540 [Nanoarchaeota archaeon]|nr:hypothetical protein [Nanoarchaeota archaeon]
MNKEKNVKKKLKIDKDFIILGNRKKFRINPSMIYENRVRLDKSNNAVIDSHKKYVGKRVIVIIDKEDSQKEPTRKDWKRMSGDWVEHMY